MPLRDYAQPWEPEVASQLGEPILRCMPMNAATVGDRFQSRSSLGPFWRPRMMVNGRPRKRLPLTMFLILTPSRVLITKTNKSMAGFRPNLSAPILTMQRGDAEITATRDNDGLWLYSLRSRATAEEVGLELMARGDIADGLAEEMAGQLRNFSVAPSTVRSASGLSDQSEADNTFLGRRRRSIARSTRVGAIITTLFALGFLGFGAFELYGYHSGKSTTATSVSCHQRGGATFCKGNWTIDENTYIGRVMGPDSPLPYGSSVDVRVSHGIAFTRDFPTFEFIWGGIFAVWTIVLLWWPRRRRRRHHGLRA